MKQINLFNCRALRWGVAALLLLVVSVAANAYNFKVDGIYYNILNSSDKTCEVTYLYYFSERNVQAYSGNVVIPETVTYGGNTYSVVAVGECAFMGCSGLTDIMIPNSVTSIGDCAFMYCTNLKEVTIPENVVRIYDYAFSGCTGLVQVNFNAIACRDFAPDNGEVGKSFENCTKLSELCIGEDVTRIPAMQFYYCTALMSITSLNPEPPTCGSSVFASSITSTCVLYVPEGTIEAYSTANGWKEFLNIVDNQPNAIEGIMTNGSAEAVGYYTLDGKQVPALQRGINIIRYSDGTAKKVLVK